jgi:hypothetical protein
MSNTTNQWLNGPFKLITDTGLKSRPEIPSTSIIYHYAQRISLVHNLFIRGLNASYHQCLGVKPDTTDAQDFLIFNQFLWEVIQDHHDVEEEFLFPELEQLAAKNQGLMKGNIEEHAGFHDSFEAFRKYVFETKANDYDGETLRVLVTTCGHLIEKHLHNEISSLIELYGCDEKKLGDIWNRLEERVFAKQDNRRHVPLLIGCSDATFQLDGQTMPFPPVPFFFPYLVRFVFGRLYAGSWRFCPSDVFGKPQPLRFAA